jgi:hypothetical protein
MAKPGRQWFPVDARFTRDEQVLEAGERAFWLFLAMLAHIYETRNPGIITRRELDTIYLQGPGWHARMPALLKVGLVIQLDPDRYQVPAWESWQGTSDRAAYMREWRRQRKQEASTDDQV